MRNLEISPRKYLALGLVFALGLTGCGGDSPETNRSDSPISNSDGVRPTADEKFDITKLAKLGRPDIYKNEYDDEPDVSRLELTDKSGNILECFALTSTDSRAGSDLECNFEAYNAQVNQPK